MSRIKPFSAKDLVNSNTKYLNFLHDESAPRDKFWKVKKKMLEGNLEFKIMEVDRQLKAANVGDDTKELEAEVKELKVKLANITNENEKISQKLKKIEGQKEKFQQQQKRVLEVFGDRMNRWKNDPRKKWQYETVKEMGEDIGIKVSTKQQDK